MARKIIWTVASVRIKNQILLYWLERNQSAVYPRKLDQLFHQAVRHISKYPFGICVRTRKANLLQAE